MLLLENCNPHLRKAQYAVRGPLSIRADEIKKMLQDGVNLPFKEVINCNIGNPHQLSQKPITYFRQVLALIEYPPLLEMDNIFPSDTISIAKKILENIKSVGAYSHSQGIPLVREVIANSLSKRDSIPIDADQIFMTNGASEGVSRILSLIITDPSIGVMIPIPQYPLYSATISLLNGTAVPYYLEEEGGWRINIQHIREIYNESKANIKVFCLINPGNPTGSLLREEEVEGVVKFCHENNLILIADEVYQENVYDHQFISVLSCVKKYSSIEVFSLHSASKGNTGECGHRGGYFHCHNIDSRVRDELYKQSSISLCSNVPGQVLMMLLSSPPPLGSPSFLLWKTERNEIFNQLKNRSIYIQKCLEEMEGISCQKASGALYLFPSIEFPTNFLLECQRNSIEPDSKYSMDLLNETGICIVPGNGFGQRRGTFHIRTTILPPQEIIVEMMERWKNFHTNLFTRIKTIDTTTTTT